MSAAVFSETVRRHITSMGFQAFCLLVGMAGMFASTFNTPGSLWPSLVTLLSVIAGSACIGPEFSTGALQLIVSKPIRRRSYLLSRVAGILTSVGLAAAFGLTAECVLRVFRGTSVPWGRLGQVYASSMMVAFLAIAILTLLGSLTWAYFNVAIYVGTQAVFTAVEAIIGVVRVKGHVVGVFLQQHPQIQKGLERVDEFLFAEAPAELDWQWLLRVAATAAVALILACVAFERREVPYGAD